MSLYLPFLRHCVLFPAFLLAQAFAAQCQPLEKRIPDTLTQRVSDSLYSHTMPMQHFHDKTRLLDILRRHQSRPADIRHLQEIEGFEMQALPTSSKPTRTTWSLTSFSLTTSK